MLKILISFNLRSEAILPEDRQRLHQQQTSQQQTVTVPPELNNSSMMDFPPQESA